MLDDRYLIETNDELSSIVTTVSEEPNLFSLVAVGFADDQYEELERYINVTRPGWIVLRASSLSSDLLDFLLHIRPSMVLVHIEKNCLITKNLITKLMFATDLVITSPCDALPLPDLQSIRIPFLQTPYTFESLHKVIGAFGKNGGTFQDITTAPNTAFPAVQDNEHARIAAWEKKNKRTVKVADIAYAVFLSTGVSLHLKDGRKLTALHSEHLRRTLNNTQFMQVNRSKYVNLLHVKSVSQARAGHLALKFENIKQEIIVNKTKIDLVKRVLCI